MAEISRTRAIEHLERHSYWTSDDYSWIDDVCAKAISDMEKMEKIEQILNKTYYNICNSCSDSALIDCKCCEFNRIEQIVKEQKNESLNAEEEVCEWSGTNGYSDEWTPSCEKNSTYNVFGVAWFKHCPYCGRKIKVVE